MTAARDVPGVETRSAATPVSRVEIVLTVIFSALVLGVLGVAGGMILLSIVLICLDGGDG